MISLFKISKVLISSVVGITLLLLFLITYLVYTETGSQFVLEKVISNSEQITVEEIHGTLANKIKLQKFQYQDASGFSIAINELNFHWKLRELLTGHLHISLIQVEGITIKGRPKSSEKNNETSEIPKIPLTISLDNLIINQLQWIIENKTTEIEHFSLSAKLVNNLLSLSHVSLAMPQIQVKANSDIQLQSDWPVNAELNWSYLLENEILTGQLVIEGNTDLLNLNSKISGLVESNQKGFIKLSTDQPEFAINGDWQKLNWPLTGEVQYSSKQGQFRISGNTEDYKTHLKASVSALHQSDFSISFAGSGNTKSMHIEHLQLKPLQGMLNATGHITWTPTIAFDIGLTADQLNPEDFGTDIPGNLTINLTGKGDIDGEKITADLAIEKITGQIHEQPIDVSGNVKLINQQLNIQQLNIVAGVNKVAVTGQLSEQQSDLSLTIKAPDLTTAWPSLKGNLEGDLKIKGSLVKPLITGTLQGENIHFENNQVGKLSLDINYALGSQQQSKLEFSAKNVQVAEQIIDNISMLAEGNEANHHAQLQLDSPLANLSVTTDGQWDGKTWQGIINQFDIDHPQLKKWQLAAPISVLINNDKGLEINLPNSCLVQKQSQLCFSAQGSPEQQLDGQINLTALPLAFVKPWLPEDVDLSGNLSLVAKLSSSSKDKVAEISGHVSTGKVLLKDGDNITHHVPLSVSTIKANYKEDRVDAQLQLEFGKNDFITAIINVDPVNNNGNRPLSGTLNSQIVEMDLIEKLIPEISQLEGQWITALKLAGSTELPEIKGIVQFKKGKFEIPRLGSTFNNINFKVTNATDKPQRLLLDLNIESGKGQLSGNGHLDLIAEDNYPLKLALTGKQFEVSRLPEAEVSISPKLNIIRGKNLTTIKGIIKIDQAKVEIKTLPDSAIAISEDEVIITADQPKTKKNKLAKMNTNVAIQFGDHSSFSGFGLETQLTGQLDYTVEDEKARMQGRAILKEATYRSYGQDLTIRKGEFIFNGPTDNPWVNIEAIRKAKQEDITAVLKVTGLLKSPETRIYTEPALPESEALSYLVTGKSINRIGEGEGNVLASAALNYGVGQLSWVRDQIGIDELEFEEGETIEDSAVKLGQYLNPDLFVGLTLGLFSSNYAVNVKYRINEQFSVDSRAGETQRIEIKYHLATE